MVVHLSNELLEQIDNVEVVSKLRVLFSYFEMEIHEWEVMLGDNISWLQNDSNGWIGEFFSKKLLKMSNQPTNFNPRIMVRVVPRNMVEAKAKLAAESVGGEFKIIVPEKRAVVLHQNRRLDIISTDIILPFLIEKLRIVVENNRSDAKFITTILKLKDGINDREFDERVRIKFENGGGNSTPQVLEVLGGVERAICIIDGDKSIFGIIEEKKVEKQEQIISVCEKLGYEFLILSKREIENYIPDEALKRWLESKGFNEEHPFFQLAENHKDHIDMKKRCGKLFVLQEFLDSLDEVAATSHGSKTKKLEPRVGFGDDVWKAFDYINSYEELKSRDSTDELEKVIELVKSNL